MNIVKPLRRFGLFAAASACVVVPVLSQNAPPATKPSFEVASVKPSPQGARGGAQIVRGGRFTMPGVTVKTLLFYAYRGSTPFLNNQIIGGPAWIDNDRFDIQAKIDCDSGPVEVSKVQLMVQSMLEDRFRLRAHLEKRELQMYDLVIGKDGPKVKPSEDQTPTNPTVTLPTGPCAAPAQTNTDVPPLPRPSFDPRGTLPRGMSLTMFMPGGNTTIRTSAAPWTTVVSMMQNQLGRFINDKTGLKGLFDVTMQFNSDSVNTPFGLQPALPPAGAAGAGAPVTTAQDPLPTLTSAVQQQLGLKLELIKGPLDVLVIESVQKPTED